MDQNTLTQTQTIEIRQAGRLAAVCDLTTVRLVAAVEGMPDEHPSKMHVMLKCLIAGSILRGELPGPYTDDEADRLAELLLEDPSLLAADEDCPF